MPLAPQAVSDHKVGLRAIKGSLAWFRLCFDPKIFTDLHQRRLRPILLTTGTTIGGLIPLYLGGGPMWEPMSVAIMFGLLFATGLTLGVVPVLYSLFFKVNYRDFEY